MNLFTRLALNAATVAGMSLTGIAGFGAAEAHADTWCPGDYFRPGMPNWDMGVCHEYYWAHKYIPDTPIDLYIEGSPPGPPLPGFCGRDMFTGAPLPC